MSRSVKKNYLYSLINTVTGILFPLIAFPYASRVIMPDGIGQVNFFQSIINYISLLSCIGIPMYAIREIAKVRDNVFERNKVAIEILILHTILTILGYVVVIILAITVSKIQVNIPLFFILSLSIMFTAIGCEWFYQGIEDFKYITLRGIIVRTLSLILLFLFVKTKDDILWYGAYTVVGSVGGNIFNFIRLNKYLKSDVRYVELKPMRHLLPAMHIFVLNLIISIYVNLNSLMLGFMKDNLSVGLFAAATKLTQVSIGVVGALGTVMLPRLSNLISNQKWDEFRTLSQKSILFIFALTLPLSIGLMSLSSYIIPLFCGNSYEKAVPTLIILAPIVFFIGISNVLGIQMLYPLGKENIVIISTAIGAIINFILNLWLIPSLSQDGAAIATLVAEFFVTITMFILGRNHLFLKWNKSYMVYILASLIMGMTIYLSRSLFNNNNIITLVFLITLGILTYILCLVSMKDPLLIEIKDFIKKRS